MLKMVSGEASAQETGSVRRKSARMKKGHVGGRAGCLEGGVSVRRSQHPKGRGNVRQELYLWERTVPA